MKRVLILSIALLFMAGLAMASISWTGTFQFGMVIFDPGATDATTTSSAYYMRLRLYANYTVSDFAKGVAEFRIEQYLNTTVAAGVIATSGDQLSARQLRWDRISVTIDMLNFFGVKDAPLDLKISTGCIDSYATSKLFRYDKQDVLKRHGNMEIVFIDRRWGVWIESTIAKMITIKIGQRMSEGEALATPSYGNGTGYVGLPYTWLSVDFNMDFISAVAAVMIDGHGGTSRPNQLRMPLNLGVGVKLPDLVKGLLGVEAGLGFSMTDVLNTGGANLNDTWAVAGARITLSFGGMTSITSAGVSFKIDPTDDTVNPFIFNIFDICEEFWLTEFMGIEVGTVMTFNPYAQNNIENIEILSLWKLGGVDVRIGYVYVPDNMIFKSGVNNGDWWYAANIYDYSGFQSPFAKTEATGGLVWEVSCKF